MLELYLIVQIEPFALADEFLEQLQTFSEELSFRKDCANQLLVSYSKPVLINEQDIAQHQATIFELAHEFIECVSANQQRINPRIVIPFEDGTEVKIDVLNLLQWEIVQGFLDIQIEHRKKPKLKIRLV